MGPDKVAITLGGVSLIGFIFWFFFMKREHMIKASNITQIIVDGGFTPETLVTEADKELILTFLRKDPSPCLEEIVLGDFGIRRSLPLNQEVQITLPPRAAGEHSFACGMNMFRGKIISR